MVTFGHFLAEIRVELILSYEISRLISILSHRRAVVYKTASKTASKHRAQSCSGDLEIRTHDAQTKVVEDSALKATELGETDPESVP